MSESSVHAELSVVPIGTGSTSLSEYIANGVKALGQVKGVKYEITPMGTLLEADQIDTIFEACKVVTETMFSMGVRRIETILKIDERRDKKATLSDKLRSVKNKTDK